MPFDATGFKQNVALLEVLLEARRRIETSWFHGAPGENVPLHGHCAVLAISRQNVGALTEPALGYLARAIYGSDNPIGIQPWNDARNPDGSPARTKDEVLAAYDTAYRLALAG